MMTPEIPNQEQSKKVIFLAGLYQLFNFVIVPREEQELEKRFGEAYYQYKQLVPRWLGKTRNPRDE